MSHPRSRGFSFSSLGTSTPPGATGPAISTPPASTGPTNPSVDNSFARVTLDALMNAPSRREKSQLHLKRIPNTLWFGIDKEVNKFMVTTWQGYYWGPWPSWKHIPLERLDTWWKAFVQQYYWDKKDNAEVRYMWEEHHKKTIRQKISYHRRKKKKPPYMSDIHWTTILEEYATEPVIKRCKIAGANRISNPDGKGMHKHTAGPKPFVRIEYDMMVEKGDDEPPPLTELVRKTHTRKDGTFIDRRAADIIQAVEETVTQMSTFDGESQTGSSSFAPSRADIDKAFLEHVVPKKGHIYGIRSAINRIVDHRLPVHISLAHNKEMDMRVNGLETKVQSVGENVEAVKEDVAMINQKFCAMEENIKAIMDMLRNNSHVRRSSTAEVPSSTPEPNTTAGQSSVLPTNPTSVMDNEDETARIAAISRWLSEDPTS